MLPCSILRCMMIPGVVSVFADARWTSSLWPCSYLLFMVRVIERDATCTYWDAFIIIFFIVWRIAPWLQNIHASTYVSYSQLRISCSLRIDGTNNFYRWSCLLWTSAHFLFIIAWPILVTQVDWLLSSLVLVPLSAVVSWSVAYANSISSIKDDA